MSVSFTSQLAGLDVGNANEGKSLSSGFGYSINVWKRSMVDIQGKKTFRCSATKHYLIECFKIRSNGLHAERTKLQNATGENTRHGISSEEQRRQMAFWALILRETSRFAVAVLSRHAKTSGGISVPLPFAFSQNPSLQHLSQFKKSLLNPMGLFGRLAPYKTSTGQIGLTFWPPRPEPIRH